MTMPDWRQQRYDQLTTALAASGVELTADDHHTAAWLAGWERETVDAVAGWIARANVAVDTTDDTDGM